MISRRALLAAAALALSACGGGAAAGDVLPAVEITGLTSGEVTLLSEIEGPAVINLWATWCAPCRAEIPDFEEVHQARGHEVRFVGINIGESTDRAHEFIEQVGATYDQFSDAAGDVSVELRATSMPTTVIIDADGAITEKHFGPLDQGDLNEAIDDALGTS